MSRPQRLRAAAAIVCLPVLFSALLSPQPPVQAANVAITTQHNDNYRSGTTTTETVLKPSNVNVSQFGKLFTIQLDANVNGQALYVPSVMIGELMHNVIIAYTSGNANGSLSSLWAFDADVPYGGKALWRHQFPKGARWTTCAPVIDTATNTIYVVTKTGTDSGPTYLRAIGLRSGIERPGSPIELSASVPGTGDGSSGGIVSFDTNQANCRPALILVDGVVYVAFAHATDSFPYHGWIFGYQYDGTQFTQTAVFCTTPNGGDGGIWMAGQGLAADDNGYIYCSVGNGTFDINEGGIDYGMCYLKLSTPDLKVVDWFAPFDELVQSSHDYDLGGGGLTGIPGTNRFFAGGTKFGSAFLLNSAKMGGFTPNGPDRVLNRIDNISAVADVGQNPVSWSRGGEKFVYLWPANSPLEQFNYMVGSGELSPPKIYKQNSSSTAGGQLSVSANRLNDGIVWAQCKDGVVRAYHAADVSKGELWDSNMKPKRDGLGSVGHWQFITISNGKVYVPNGSSQILVYGLLPN